MKPKALWAGVTFAVVVGAALSVLHDRGDSAAGNRDAKKAVARHSTTAARPQPALSGPAAAARAAEDPKLARPLASYRVREEQLPDSALGFTGIGYETRVDAAGLRMRANGHEITLRGARIEQGERTLDLLAGAVAHPAFGVARIDRGGGVTEEYVFENRRVEQLFRIAAPPHSGALRVRTTALTDVGGPVREFPRRLETWKDLTLKDGGLAFCTPQGEAKFTYHGAVAIDAAGRKEPLECGWKDGEIVLEVPRDFMALAAFPITIDPWLELDLSASNGGISKSATVSQNPSLVVAGENPFVAWAEEIAPGNFEILLKYWTGLEWRGLGGSDIGGGISGTSGASVNPILVLDSAGNPMVAWEDDSGGSVSIYVKVFDPIAGTWNERSGSATVNGVSASAGVSSHPSLSVTQVIVPSTGRVVDTPFVVWQSTFPRSEIMGRVYYVGDPGDILLGWPTIDEGWYSLGNSGRSAGLSSTLAGTSENPSVVATFRPNGDAVGAPACAWEDSESGNYEIYCRFFVPNPAGTLINGVTFPPFPFVPNAPLGGGPTGVDVTGSWQTAPGSPVNVSATAGQSLNPSLALDGNNNPHIAWQETVGTNQEIFMAANLGGGWVGLGGSTTGGGVSGGPASTLSPGPSFYPSLAVSTGGVPMITWQDDSSGNSEIFVRQFRAGVDPAGGPWGQVGLAGSANFDPLVTQLGGISQTNTASWQPKIKFNFAGNPVVAWQDFVNNAQFDIYVRAFYANQPTNCRMTKTDGVTLIAAGGSTDEMTLHLRCTPVSEFAGVQLAIQVEVRPFDSDFTTTPTGQSIFVNSGVEAVFVFTGLPNVSYKWQVRSIDQVGRTSPWTQFGGNTPADADFAVLSVPPSAPQAPTQISATPQTSSISLSWTAPGGTVNSYNIKRSTVSGGGGYPAGTIIVNIPATSTTYIDLTAGQLGPPPVPGTPYFYVISAINGVGEGPNSAEVTATIPAGGGPPPVAAQPKGEPSACGFLGIEFALGAAILALSRRGRKGRRP